MHVHVFRNTTNLFPKIGFVYEQTISIIFGKKQDYNFIRAVYELCLYVQVKIKLYRVFTNRCKKASCQILGL